MSFNGSGTFQINTAGQPVVSGTVISSTAFNALTADLATGLSTCITKDGQTTVTANIPMATFKFTGLGAGSAATDSANLSQVQSTVVKLLGSVSGADTITAVGSPVVTAYAAGQMFYFVAAGANTTTVTLNIDGLGAKAVTRDGATALAAGDIQSGEVCVVVYDGTRFQLINAANSFGNTTINGTLTVTGNTNLQANVSITSALNVGGVATFTSNPVLSAGTANGVLYLNASKAATSGSALTFDGTNLGTQTILPNTNVTYNLGSATRRWISVFAGELIDGTDQLVGSASTTARFGFGSGWTAQAFAVSGSESMRLTGTGLGIGTSSPGRLIDAQRDQNSATQARIRNDNNGTASQASSSVSYGDFSQYLTMAQYSPSFTTSGLRVANSSGLFTSGNSNGLRVYTIDAYPLIFGTSDTERARIDSSGNLGLGVAPTATAGVTEFAVGSASTNPRISGIRDGSNAFLIYGDSSGTDVYERRNLYMRFGTNNTERARITSAGNFGIGTTSPSAKLSVNGNAELLAGGTLFFQNSVNTGSSTILCPGGGSMSLRSYGNEMIGLSENATLIFSTNSAERARITSGGDFYIGNSTGDARLLVSKASDQTEAAPHVRIEGNGYSGFHWLDATAYYIGQNSASRSLRIYSSAETAGVELAAGGTSWGTFSDERLKYDIEPITNAVDSLSNIRTVKYRLKDVDSPESKKKIGVIAQDLVGVIDEVVDSSKRPDDETDYLNVRYSELIPVLVKAIQEQQAMINELKAEVAALKGA